MAFGACGTIEVEARMRLDDGRATTETRPPRGRRLLASFLATTLSLVLAAPAHAASAHTAYVANSNSNTITPIDTDTNVAGAPFPSGGSRPLSVAITPDGTTAYVANRISATAVPIDLSTEPPTPGAPIPTGGSAFAVAVAPDGATAYVANFDSPGTLIPIDVAAGAAGPAIPVGGRPDAIAIAPDGDTAYTANFADGTVTAIDLTTGPPTPGATIPVGTLPQGIAITPDGTKAYVANCASDDVSVIETATNTVTATIPVGDGPNSIAITPDGETAFTPNCSAGTITPITTATNLTGPVIPAGTLPYAIAITPDGVTSYVTDDDIPGEVTPIDIATSPPTPGAPIPVGDLPEAIAITPDQGPTAAFTAGAATAGQPASFDASGSSDPDGTVASYAWDFGDGATATTASPTTTHTYAQPGTFTATLTVTDDEGCSTQFVFTGQTASCNGSTSARTQRAVTVNAPPDPPSPTTARLTITAVELDRRAGTAKLTVEATVSGSVAVSKTKKVKATQPFALSGGSSAELDVVPRRRAARALRRKGRLEVNPRALLHADGGGQLGERRKLTLRRD